MTLATSAASLLILLPFHALAQEAPSNHPLQAFLAEQAKHQATFQQLNGQLADLQRKLDADPNLPLRHEINDLRRLTAEIRSTRTKIEKANSPLPVIDLEIHAKYFDLKVTEKLRDLAARDKSLVADRAAISARIAATRTDIEFAAQLEAAAADQIRVLRQDRLIQKEAAELQDLQRSISPSTPIGLDVKTNIQ